MQNTRSILELLKLLLSNIDMLEKGLCHLALKLCVRNYMFLKELEVLKQYFANNMPGVFKEGDYWWPKGEVQPRLDWINSHIILNNERS